MRGRAIRYTRSTSRLPMNPLRNLTGADISFDADGNLYMWMRDPAPLRTESSSR